MKKLIISLIIAVSALAQATAQQGQFFGVSPDKFMALLGQTQKMPRENAVLIVKQTMEVLSTDPKSYRKGLDLALPHLSDPTDSLHNEDLYITLLEHATKSYVLSSSEKARPQALLESALKNRVGSQCNDIDYVTLDGTQHNLLNNDNCFTLVYFNDPDCDACAKVKENLGNSPFIKQAVETGQLRVVAINPMANEKLWKKTTMPSWVVNGWNKSQSINEGGSFDLPTLPVFFLLGRDNTVLLKNEASLKRIEKAVTMVMASSQSDSKTLANLLFMK